jgi:hypothetical protein
MPTRPSKKALDFTQIALQVVEAATGEPLAAKPPKNPAAVALGRLGASKGGKARAAKLSATRRKQIAKKAAKARWTGKQ